VTCMAGVPWDRLLLAKYGEVVFGKSAIPANLE